jgi:hypothetical protein
MESQVMALALLQQQGELDDGRPLTDAALADRRMTFEALLGSKSDRLFMMWQPWSKNRNIVPEIRALRDIECDQNAV